MDAVIKDIQISEINLPDALEAQIDKDIEQSEREIAEGDGFMEAHEAFRKIREKHGFV